MTDRQEPTDGALAGGWQTSVRRIGKTVHRSPREWSSSVMALLTHLHQNDFAGAPRPIGSGFTPTGDELLTFMHGDSLQPHPWSDDGLNQLGVMLREFHDAAAMFQPPPDTTWQDWFGRALGDPTAGFGHGDLGPWNIMAIDGMPVGFIDWDTAGPMDPVWEVAQAAWLNVQLHDDDVAEKLNLEDAARRAAQLAIFLDGYRLPASDRPALVDKMIEVAVRSAAAEAIEHDITEDTTTGVAPNGYPITWGLAWRIRSARWMLQHRSTLEAAITGS